MNSDLTDDDMASSTTNTLIPSLAEHSYCASLGMSTGSTVVTTEVPVSLGDLFGSSPELQSGICQEMSTSIRFPIGLIGDVNLDGFNYSVPSVSTGDMENMWNGLSSETCSSVIEVAATNEEELMACENNGGVVVESGQSKIPKKRRNQRSKRTDVIGDREKRRNHFDIYYRRLVADFNRIKSRTGCDGTLNAAFEGKSYDSNNINPFVPPVNDVYPLLSHSTTVTTTTNEPLVHDGMDDHRYAATMLTQNVSSSAVRDHQYDEKTVVSGNESDTSEYNEDECPPGGKVRIGNRFSKRYRYDYIKIRWARTQAFCKVIRTLFSNKKNLEQRTGAQIHLSLEYEDNFITEDNFLIAGSIIASCQKERELKSKRIISLAPRRKSPLQSQQLPIAPLSFIFPVQLPYIIPGSSRSVGIPIENSVPVTVTVSPTIPNISHAVTNPAQNDCENDISSRSDFEGNHISTCNDNLSMSLMGNNSISIPASMPMSPNEAPNERNFAKSDDAIQSSGASSPRISAMEGNRDNEDDYTFNYSVNSPEIAVVARGMQESATNTEPICSICFKTDETPSHHTVQSSSPKSFWIRCNDPFCYDMVHASCVGFVVTHTAHLKQLPAFYCKSHR